MNNKLTKTIAILEPHEILRLCLAEVLTHLNYNVIIRSGNAFDFIELLATADEHPDIIISEVQLNDLQDISMFRHLRYHYPETKILAFSADGSEWTIETALKDGADAFLEKGCSLHNLQQVLSQISSLDYQSK
ncbi:MAG: response regulator transcription factor [Chitinophagaceae bacterium]|nr:MAG: response regulator transcription factor [Chitinophagaceae bacterium]